MNPGASNFELDHKGVKLKVQSFLLNGQQIYRVVFPDNRKPLVIARPLNANATRFWTSIPEGRQKEAEEIGTLIAAHLQKK